MAIQKLPEYIINRLKAGEVVERPASVIKELTENSLDAGATELEIHIKNWGKSFLSVKDNGSGIELSDMDLLLERYATSKIKDDKDLQNISSYGFRGEALASISEISKISITSKTKYAQIASKLQKRGAEIAVSHHPHNIEQGTEVIVEDLFFNVPARLKFLKSAQTEYYYCYNLFIELALYHFDKSFKLFKDDKLIFDLQSEENILPRINAIFKKDRTEKLLPISYTNENIALNGIIGDPSLRFWSGENIKIFVNSRPVQDKIIKRAIMDSFRRQITPWEFPLAVLFIQTTGTFVDVNVHPRKMEVKFIDSQQVFHAVTTAIKTAFAENKISHSQGIDPNHFYPNNGNPSFQNTQQSTQQNIQQNNYQNYWYKNNKPYYSNPNPQQHYSSENLFWSQEWTTNLRGTSTFESNIPQEVFSNSEIGEYQIIGQIWNSYIILQANEALYYVDQHALAERIAFEKMKKMYHIETNNEEVPITKREKEDSISPWLNPEPLLNPLKYELSNIPNLEQKIEELNHIGFDCALISENKLVVYSIPKIFVIYPIDLEKLFNQVLYLEQITFDIFLDNIFATKACKTSIKAGHKLSFEQMAQLIKDGFEHIEWLFVCQHGRPFFIQIDKKNIDKLFDR